MKFRDYCSHMLNWLDAKRDHYPRVERLYYDMCNLFHAGQYNLCHVKFQQSYPSVLRVIQQYHFATERQYMALLPLNFIELCKGVPKLPEAQILYDKGFDRTDLLMLSDLVDSPTIVYALRTATEFRRGFWALDVLRDIYV